MMVEALKTLLAHLQQILNNRWFVELSINNNPYCEYKQYGLFFLFLLCKHSIQCLLGEGTLLALLFCQLELMAGV